MGKMRKKNEAKWIGHWQVVVAAGHVGGINPRVSDSGVEAAIYWILESLPVLAVAQRIKPV